MPFDNPQEHPHARLLDLEDRLVRRDFPFMAWNYSFCGTCGLAIHRELGVWRDHSEIERYYGINEKQAMRIFCGAGGTKLNREVTVDDVITEVRKVLQQVVVA